MLVTQRNQLERPELMSGGEAIRRGSERLTAVLSLIGLAAVPPLLYATLVVANGWASWAVLGAIVATAVGIIIAVNPRRQA